MVHWLWILAAFGFGYVVGAFVVGLLPWLSDYFGNHNRR